jgi:hypothetical protein
MYNNFSINSFHKNAFKLLHINEFLINFNNQGQTIRVVWKNIFYLRISDLLYDVKYVLSWWFFLGVSLMHNWSHHKPSARTPRLPPCGSSPPLCRRSALPASLCLPSFVSLPTPLLATHPLRPHLPPMAWQHPRCQPVGFGGGDGSWRRR